MVLVPFHLTQCVANTVGPARTDAAEFRESARWTLEALQRRTADAPRAGGAAAPGPPRPFRCWRFWNCAAAAHAAARATASGLPRWAARAAIVGDALALRRAVCDAAAAVAARLHSIAVDRLCDGEWLAELRGRCAALHGASAGAPLPAAPSPWGAPHALQHASAARLHRRAADGAVSTVSALWLALLGIAPIFGAADAAAWSSLPRSCAASQLLFPVDDVGALLRQTVARGTR
ncbi:hypothetical protein M885DRAFT_570334 [Pelagophyceae sp. CCMP2097]|nr:hypothetical protein M885DRAFT_570334 [Pelagophyceae sp. CCMP2097]